MVVGAIEAKFGVLRWCILGTSKMGGDVLTSILKSSCM